MDLTKQIKTIRKEFFEDLRSIQYVKEVEDLKIKYLGKKGKVQALMIVLKEALPQERPLLGKEINLLKEEIIHSLEEHFHQFSFKEQQKKLLGEKIDITCPGRRQHMGHEHPVMIILHKALDILSDMGFSVQYGPDLESDFYNFEGLNFPKDHPARDMQDTFWVSDNMLLRTHTSNVQVRIMESNKPPLRVIAPGRCFRNETISSRSHLLFHQIEGFYVDKGVTFGDLMATLDTFFNRLFERDIETRFRPSFFPFVEPGMESDIRCTGCDGKGCRLCKETGWLEVGGSGMIHPEVLKVGGIDPEEYRGYAWGIGIERLALLIYGIDDIRLFTENDMRFLEQFQPTI